MTRPVHRIPAPRGRLARRFEPRGGVTQSMLEAEARWVARELADYLLRTPEELRRTFAERKTKIEEAEENLRDRFHTLSEAQGQAQRCMLARDFHHIAALYQTYLRSAPTAKPDASPPETPVNSDGPAVPFTEMLFGP